MPPKKKQEKSPSSTPVPTTETAQTSDGSQLPDAQWEAMQNILNAIYDYRTEDGFDPSKLFHRKVNKRVLPEYYETIKEPMALSTVKAKIHTRAYQSFAEFVRDFALIPHNAQVFNRPDSGAFQDALVIKEQLEKQLQLLVEKDLITKEVAALPDLGEIPTYEDLPAEEVEGEGEEEEESDEDAEEDDDDDDQELDDEGKPKRKRGRPRGSTNAAKREAAGEDDNKRSRGRPPKLLTPTEARILAIMRGIRKPKNKDGLMIRSFDRLPDKAVMPEYYAEVKNPMAFDLLKRKVKRKKYPTLEAFMADVNLMFNNAKEYNTDDSEIFKEAVQLQVEAGKLYDAEKAKPDDEFADEDGKIPMPNGILHNGELYKVGDWVHLQNPNDLTKPVPCQVYRTYKNPNGQSMVNICWYYRPEQTVHRFDKHFLHNEIVKTGRYRDHHIEEIEGKCFVMFYTRYFKGRPRNLPEGTEVYVCKDRYNEVLHQFNTIKTWASCLPDEVRDKDYEMDLFDHPRKMKKFPSPIAYMLKDEQKETDELPKVQWGADGAPPKIGAVHRRPRNEKDSPPPEPTPPPQPKVETPAPRPLMQSAPSFNSTTASQPQQPQQPRAPSTSARPPSFSATHPLSATPQPAQTPATQQQQQPQRPPSSSQTNYNPMTPQPPKPTTTTTTNIAPQSSTYQQTSSSQIPPNPTQYPRPSTSSNYRDPPPIEVYTLPDQANLSIPPEIRAQYQRDEFGRVLFFTTPPAPSPETSSGSAAAAGAAAIGSHSARYLAEKARRKDALALKRKAHDAAREEEERVAKVQRVENRERLGERVAEALRKGFRALDGQLAGAVEGEIGEREVERLGQAQMGAARRKAEIARHGGMRREARRVKLGERGGFADDWDTRMG